EYVSRFDGSLKPRDQWGKNDPWKSDGLPGKYLTDQKKDGTQYIPFKPSKDAKEVTWYTMSYGAQYILGLKSDPKLTSQQLAQYAEDHFGVPPYGNSVFGGTGAASTINGDANTKSKHAILYYGGQVDPFLQNNIQEMTNFLNGQHYDSVTTLFANGP